MTSNNLRQAFGSVKVKAGSLGIGLAELAGAAQHVPHLRTYTGKLEGAEVTVDGDGPVASKVAAALVCAADRRTNAGQPFRLNPADVHKRRPGLLPDLDSALADLRHNCPRIDWRKTTDDDDGPWLILGVVNGHTVKLHWARSGAVVGWRATVLGGLSFGRDEPRDTASEAVFWLLRQIKQARDWSHAADWSTGGVFKLKGSAQ